MKNKQKKEQNIKVDIDLSWQKLSELEAGLRRVLSKPDTLPLSQQYFELMINSSKQILNTIDVLKSKQKHYQTIQNNYNLIQAKLSNHEGIISNMEKNHHQRMKVATDQSKNIKEHYQKTKKTLIQAEQQARTQAIQVKKQNSELKIKIEFLSRQKQDFLQLLEQKNKQINQLQHKLQTLRNLLSSNKENQPLGHDLENLICSDVGHKIVQYLGPSQIVDLQLLNKRIRIYLTKSKSCQISLCKSVNRVKDRHVRYYHKHIDYFQKLYHKIPEEILQTTFYSFEIAKQQIGTEILQILNSSALLFQGKFTDVQEQLVINESEIRESDIERLSQENYLQIDEEIVREHYEDKKNRKQKINKQIILMYKKIQDTAQLYSADVESIGLFLKNVLKNFSKVFVLSKNLYTEARNLQSLNTFLLSELSRWDKGQVHKNSLIQDLKAQLDAQRKIRIFFTEKGIKSEQRALNQQNIKLGMEMKYNKQIQKLDEVCREKQELKNKLEALQLSLKNVQNQNKQIRRAYENGRQKYNKIIEELGVVKETILRMNIM